jgi:YesN/AraC family two-component response regulator
MGKNLIYYETADKTFNFHHSIGLIEGDDKFYSHLHKHNCYEIMYVLDGSVDHYIEGEKYRLTKGNALIINYNELHMLKNVSNNFERMVVHISRDFITPFISVNVDLFKSFKAREQGRDNALTAEITSSNNFKEYFNRIEKLCRDDTPENEILIKCLMTEILVMLNKIHSEGGATSAKEYSSAVKDVIRYINNHLTEDLSLDRITGTLYVTKTYLCHLFKKKTGISIVRYITYKRILLADELLSSGMSASEACYKSGFNNYSNFYKSYAKVMGHSPTGKKLKPELYDKINKTDLIKYNEGVSL